MTALTQNTVSYLLLMGVLLLFSAFFSGSETALFSLTSDQRRQISMRRRKVSVIFDLVQTDPGALLLAILLGNLIVNVLFYCTGAALAGRLGQTYGGWAEALAGFAALSAVILGGEIVPKALGISQAERMIAFTAPPLRIWFILTAPLRRVFRTFTCLPLEDSSRGLTAAEFKILLDSVCHEPHFGESEKEILEDIVNLPDLRVREIMVPRVNVLRVALDRPPGEVIAAAREREFSRVLVHGTGNEDVLGFVSVKELFLTEAEELEPYLHPVAFIPETCRADSLLREFLDRDLKLVAVVDEYGGLAGIVTLEDLLEEIVGEFEEGEEEIFQLSETRYRLNGQFSIREWRELFLGFLSGQEVESMAFDTLGGLIVSQLGRMPRAGDCVAIRNIRLTVESVANRRVGTVLLELEGGAS